MNTNGKYITIPLSLAIRMRGAMSTSGNFMCECADWKKRGLHGHGYAYEFSHGCELQKLAMKIDRKIKASSKQNPKIKTK